MGEAKIFDLLVLGGGPGGYTAAFRAADLGLSVCLVEKQDRLGGVCLNVGCIPSKTLLHAATVIEEAAEASDFGIEFSSPKIDTDRLLAKKNSVIDLRFLPQRSRYWPRGFRWRSPQLRQQPSL